MTGFEAPASFDEACQRFSTFLRKNGYSERVLWVEQEDIVWDKRQIWVREHPALDRACQRYSRGIKAGLGVQLYAFLTSQGTTIAAVVLPADEDAAQRHLMPHGGMKLTAATKMLSARRVSSQPIWLMLSLLHRSSSRSFTTSYLDCT